MEANNKLLLCCDGATASDTVGLDDATLLRCIGNATGQEPRGQRYLAVVGWKLVQQLLDPVSLPWAVHVRHPVLRQAAEVLVDLHEERRTRQVVKLCTNLSNWKIYTCTINFFAPRLCSNSAPSSLPVRA